MCSQYAAALSHTLACTGEDCYAGNDGFTTTIKPVTPGTPAATVAPTKAAAATVAPTKPVVAKPTAVPVPAGVTVAPTAVSLNT
jgi:hypothetical protein